VRRRVLVYLIVLGIAISPEAAVLCPRAAGAAEPSRIAVFDGRELLAQSKRLSTMIAEFEAKRAALQKEIDETQKSMRDLVQSAKQTSRSTVTGLPEVRAAQKSPEMQALNEKLERQKREAIAFRSQSQRQIRDHVVKATRSFARENGYTVVFDRSHGGIIYIDDAVDITLPLAQWMDRSQ
jgi:Skp family chaperone for outer membrane proteins